MEAGRSSAHEFGHLLDLGHPQKGEYMSNLMQQGTGSRWGGVSTDINSKQLLQINNNRKYMNQGTNYQYSKSVMHGKILDKKIPYKGFATSFIR